MRCKRGWDEQYDEGETSDVDLGSSLKKVRISLTPGELRLDRDLCQLANWTKMSDRSWVLRSDVHLERLNNPLQLLLRVADAKVYIQLSRMYPHVPPVVAHVENPGGRFQRVAVNLIEPVNMQNDDDSIMTVGSQRNQFDQNTLVYNYWSPIRWLGELLHFLINAFDNDRLHWRAPMPQLPSKHSTLFAPNRFDLGYDRSNMATSTRPMEC